MNNKVKVIVFIVFFILAFVATRAILDNIPVNKNENEIASIENENSDNEILNTEDNNLNIEDENSKVEDEILNEKNEEQIIENQSSNTENINSNIENEIQNTENQIETSFKGGEVITVNSSNFEQEVLKSNQKVLIDFYADWCGPCQMLSPLIDEVAKEYTDVKFVRVDVDTNEDLSNQYGVIYIPKLVVIENGNVIDESVGYIEKNQIESLIK